MAEPEGVLLEIAERASAPLRSLWARSLPSEDSAGHVDRLRLELQVFLIALFGHSWPLQALPPPRSRGKLLRKLSRRVRTMEQLLALSYTDGRMLYLAGAQSADNVDEKALRSELRCTALGLGARIVRGSLAWVPHEPLARDLYWAADARQAETHLICELPGLAAELEARRRAAHDTRARLHRPTPLEQRAEAYVRSQLTAAARERVPADAHPAAIARWAERTARQWRATAERDGDYRGIQPVPFWGRALRVDPPRPATDRESSNDARRGLPARSVRVQAESPSEAREEQGSGAPLLIPPGDSQGSVEAAGRTPPPKDSGEEDVDTLAEELERLQRVTRVRSDLPVKEVLESESATSSALDEARSPTLDGDASLAYPEWDYRTRRYRAAHCVVHDILPKQGDPAWARELCAARRSVIRRLRQQAQQLRPERERRRREPHGTDLDLDAYVEAHADRRAVGLAHDRLYVDSRRSRRDLAVVLLIDASASTDRWLDSRRRVIDLEREAALLFCESASAVGDRHAVFAFSGEGPRQVRVAALKSFSEAYGERVGQRIAGLDPDAYTRLGGALRHVARALVAEPARRRLLLLLSDGRPNDADEYQGRYGIEDTRRAAAEIQLLGIRLFCVNIDRHPSVSLARIFGQTGHANLRHVEQLPERLSAVYRELAHG